MSGQGRHSSPIPNPTVAAALALAQLKPASPSQLLSALIEHGNAVNLLNAPEHLLPLLASTSHDDYWDYVKGTTNSAIRHEISRIQNQCENLGAQVIALGSDEYPSLLAEIPSPPPLLYVRGNCQALHLPNLAIVGARHCTAQGGQNAQQFAKELAAGGFAITSGLALGIDGYAHQGALAGQGITVGVMATGIDRIYPSRHRALAESILAEGGCLISEFPLGSAPARHHFPRRNRIISGLALGVLVVEAKVKSGSLLTANAALKQNREVFALPGSIHNPMAKGCHQLIKEGAHLVESTDDILAELQGALAFKRAEISKPTPSPDEDTNNPILQALGFEPMAIDDLAAELNTPIDQLLAELLDLELEGLVSQSEGRVERLLS